MIEINEISPEKANEYLQSGALLIDVREVNEVQQVAYDTQNIQNIVFSSFDENYLNIPKDKKLIIACAHGIRSLRVAQFLVHQGWNVDKVFSLNGGMESWKNAKLPVKFAPRSFSIAKPDTSCNCDSNGCC
ncbi:MAG: rhodanese-like domain-containing protein [Paludibacter sp.]